jgi:hypothetical protein
LIGKFDWPEEWPTLFDSLVECISGRDNATLFDGAMKCLLHFVEYVDPDSMPEALSRMGPLLFGILLDRTHTPQYVKHGSTC